MTMKKIAALAAAGTLAISLGGCAAFDKIAGTDTASLTPQQKVVLTAQIVNGACVLSAAGLAFAGGVNAIVHPNAGSGGSGASAAGTITKASALGALSCQSLNGIEATLLKTTAAGTATVQVTQ